MSTIDRAALIEQAATAAASIRNDYVPTTVGAITYALPDIAKALLAPLRELHHDHVCGDVESAHWCHVPDRRDGRCIKVGDCAHCGLPQPCPTSAVLDAIEAEVQP